MRVKITGMIFLVIGLILTLPAHYIAQTTWHFEASDTSTSDNGYSW